MTHTETDRVIRLGDWALVLTEEAWPHLETIGQVCDRKK